jgi:hypothetical protein
MKSSHEVSRKVRLLGAVLFAAAAALVSPSVLASPDFPTALAAAVPMPCVPTCDVCHITAAGGPGNVRPDGFADTLRDDYGLFLQQPGTVEPAVEAARAAQMNTDGDEMPDIDELVIGRNPNSADPSVYICGGDAGGPQYGCGAGRIAKGDSLDGVATFFAASALALGAALLHRRLRRP